MRRHYMVKDYYLQEKKSNIEHCSKHLPIIENFIFIH